MLDLFVEGLESALLPCSLVLLIPGLAITFTGRKERIVTVTAFIIGVIIYTWLIGSERGSGISHTATGIIFGVAALVSIPRESAKDLQKTTLIAGLLTGIGAGSIWIPCTGEHLADLQESLPNRGIEGIFSQGVYDVAVLVPLIVVLLAMNAIKPQTLERFLRPAAYVGSAILMIFAITTITDNQTFLINRLFEWSV